MRRQGFRNHTMPRRQGAAACSLSSDLFSNSSVQVSSVSKFLRPDHSQAPRASAGGFVGVLRESKSGTSGEVPSTAR